MHSKIIVTSATMNAESGTTGGRLILIGRAESVNNWGTTRVRHCGDEDGDNEAD